MSNKECIKNMLRCFLPSKFTLETRVKEVQITLMSKTLLPCMLMLLLYRSHWLTISFTIGGATLQKKPFCSR